MSEEIEPKKKVVTKKTTKVKAVALKMEIQGKEVTPDQISESKQTSICLEIQKWKNGGNLDAQTYARIMRLLDFEVSKLPRRREQAMKFASELNALGEALGCKTVAGKRCCG